jgi:polyisoprenoid-binding protein YceI
VQAPGGSTLAFTVVQAGASNTGTFKQFATELRYDENNLAGSTLKVTVQIASLATGDKDRDDTLKSADLIEAQKYPTALFQANSFTKNAGGALEAAGKLTLRGVTRDLRVPLSIHTTATGLEISGETTIRRLDYGIGQGEWQSTGTVGDTIKLQYKVQLSRAS